MIMDELDVIVIAVISCQSRGKVRHQSCQVAVPSSHGKPLAVSHLGSISGCQTVFISYISHCRLYTSCTVQINTARGSAKVGSCGKRRMQRALYLYYT